MVHHEFDGIDDSDGEFEDFLMASFWSLGRVLFIMNMMVVTMMRMME